MMTEEHAWVRYRYYSRMASRPEASVEVRRVFESMAGDSLRRATALGPTPQGRHKSAEAVEALAR